MSPRAACALLVLMFAACTRPKVEPAQRPEPARAIVLVSADTRGYLNPCGCSENMRGGIARAAHQLEHLRDGPLPLLFFDGGNTLFGTTEIPPERRVQDEARARTLAQALNAMKVDARARGQRDLTLGWDFLRSLGLPPISGTLQLFEAGRVRVGIAQIASATEVEDASRAVRASGAHFTLAFIDAPLETARQWVEGTPFSLAIATRSEGEFGAEENRVLRTSPPVAQLQSKGRSLLRIDLSVTGERKLRLVPGPQDQERKLAALGERIALLEADVNRPEIAPELKRLKSAKLTELVRRRAAMAHALPPAPASDAFQLRYIPLEASLPASGELAAEVASLVAGYDRAIGDINLAWAREHGKDCPPAGVGAAAFVGTATCRDCHAEAFGVYESSKHAHAWETLVDAGKQFHLDCVGCHVTGRNQPGGVCRLDRVEGREDVGCESCHGPGSLHIAAPSSQNIVAAPKAAQCVGCHNPENSPHFDFERYLPRVLGPGHGG